MARKANPQVTRLAVIYLRKKARMTQAEFGQAARVDQGDVSDYELGNKVPEEPVFRRMARVAGVPWHVVVHLLRFYEAVDAAAQRWSRAGAPPIDRAVLDVPLLAVTPYLLEEAESGPPPLEELLQEAEEIWAVLEPLPPEERRRRIETAPPGACRSWPALAQRVCEASVRSAAGSAEEALERARLALLIAERVPGEEGARPVNSKGFEGGWTLLP